MRLAERLGKTQSQLLREIGSRELTKWMAKDRIDPPFNPHLALASLFALLANLLGDGKKKWKPQDFMPDPITAAPKRKQTVAEMRAMFGGFAARQSKKAEAA